MNIFIIFINEIGLYLELFGPHIKAFGDLFSDLRYPPDLLDIISLGILLITILDRGLSQLPLYFNMF